MNGSQEASGPGAVPAKPAAKNGFRRRLVTLTAVGGLALSMATIAGLANAASDDVGVQPLADEVVGGELRARVVNGVQIYRCKGGAFVQFNVRATLDGGINHFFESELDQEGEAARPVWEVAGGRVVGSAPQPTSNGDGNIPLLSLTGTGSGVGPLSTVTRIQRLETQGGVAPARACNDGEIADVPYQALYVFTS